MLGEVIGKPTLPRAAGLGFEPPETKAGSLQRPHLKGSILDPVE